MLHRWTRRAQVKRADLERCTRCYKTPILGGRATTKRLALGLALSAALPFAFGGQWAYATRTDTLTGKQAEYAVLDSDNSIHLGFPYSGDNHGRLTVRRHPQYGVNILFAVGKGQIICGVYECALKVRYDENKPQQLSTLRSGDGDSTTVFVKEGVRKSALTGISAQAIARS